MRESSVTKVKLLYTGIRVTNIERSLVFYKQALGLTEIDRGTMSHGGVYVLLEDRDTKQRLELNFYPVGSRFSTPFTLGEGLDHIGFLVDDLDGMIKELCALGAKVVVDPWTEGKTRIAFLTDPDGNWIEIMQKPSLEA
jgi:lactoylglutathione lyase